MDTSPEADERTYRAPQITTRTYEAPDETERVEIDIESQWGSWDAAHGALMTLRVENTDRSRSWGTMLDLSLDEAEQLAAALTAAVAARRAHPPTAPELILRAYNNLVYANGGSGGDWLDLAELSAAPELEGLDANALAADLADLADGDGVELEAGPGGLTVNGHAYARMREVYPHREEVR